MTLSIGYGIQREATPNKHSLMDGFTLNPCALPAADAGAPPPPHPRGLPGCVFRFALCAASSALPPAE